MQERPAAKFYRLIENGNDQEASQMIAQEASVLFDNAEEGGLFNALKLALKRSKYDLISQVLTKVRELGKEHLAQVLKMILHDELLVAVKEGNEWVTGQLLAAGADINRAYGINFRGFTPLVTAVKSGNIGLVRYLLTAGADVNMHYGYADDTPLIAAVEKGNEQMVIELLVAGADVNAQGYMGSTALISAVKGGKEILVRLLLLAGADTSIIDHLGQNAHQDAKGKIRDLIEAHMSNPFGFCMDNISDYLAIRQISIDALPDKIVKLWPDAIKQFLKFAIKHERADLIYPVISRYSDEEYVAATLADKNLVNEIRNFLIKDTRNNKEENLQILALPPMQEPYDKMMAAKKIITAKQKIIKALRGPEEEGVITVLKAMQTALDIQFNKGKIIIKKNGELIRTIPHNLGDGEIMNELLFGAIDMQDYNFAAKLMEELKVYLGIRRKDGISYFYYIADRYFALSQVNNQDEHDKVTLANLKELYRVALLDQSIDINSTVRSNRRTLLHNAAAMGLEIEVAILILRGVDPLIKDKNGKIAADYYKAAESSIGFNFLNMSPDEILKNEKVMREVLKSYSVDEIEKIVQASGKSLDAMTKEQLNSWAGTEVTSTQAPLTEKREHKEREHKSQDKRVQSLDDEENIAKQKAEQDPYKMAVKELCDRIEKHAGGLPDHFKAPILRSLEELQSEKPNKTWAESSNSNLSSGFKNKKIKPFDRRQLQLYNLGMTIVRLAHSNFNNDEVIRSLCNQLEQIHIKYDIEQILEDERPAPSR